MAAVDLNVMATNIKNILAGVSGMAAAFDYEPQTMPNLPAATLYFDGFSENEATISKLEYDWRWTIRIYIPLNQSDVGPPQISLRTITTAVLLAFRTQTNITLGGQCLYSVLNSGDVYAVLNVPNPMLVSEITLVATTQEPRL